MNYNNAIEKTILFIESHLTASFTVEDAAREAGYSYYHLNRQFSAVLGESVGSYIKKRRLSHAARELIYTERRIIDIALDHGFESSEAFSRAFKAVYHTSPAGYRKNRLDVIISQKPKADQHLLAHLTQSLTVRPRIVEIPHILTAGLRDRTPCETTGFPSCGAVFLTSCPRFPVRSPAAAALAYVNPAVRETPCTP